jgi:uncharacterized protein YigE (DUF2233 family)
MRLQDDTCRIARVDVVPLRRRDRSHDAANGITIASAATVKWLVAIVLNLLVSLPFIAQPGASPYRKDFEKEKNGPHGECSSGWKHIESGLDYRAIHCLGGDELDVHVVRVDMDKWQVNTALEERSSARTIARDHDSPFAINANFFDRPQNALGAIVRSGTIVQNARNSSWQSIFLIDEDGEPHIVLPSKWKSWSDRAFMAVQAGPRLVIDGHTNKVSKSYSAERAGVCITKHGELLFFATPRGRKFDMYEIGRVTRRGEDDGGLNCRDAMLFDGGHSTQVYLDGDDKHVDVTGDPVPVFIYIKRK